MMPENLSLYNYVRKQTENSINSCKFLSPDLSIEIDK